MSTVRIVAKNTLALSIGQIVSRGLAIVYFAALGRYVQATGLGQITTGQSLGAVVFVFVNLGLDMLTVRDVARDRNQIGSYFINVGIIKMVLGTLAVLLLLVIGWVGPYGPSTRTIIFIYGLGYLSSSIISITRAFFQAYERMEYDSFLQVGRDLLNLGAGLLAISMKASLEIIVWISVWTSILQLAGAILTLRTFRVRLVSSIQAIFCKQLFIKALPFSAVVIMVTAYSQTNTILLPILQGERATGLYSSANLFYTTLAIIPMMFSQAIFPVFSRFSESSREKLGIAYQGSFKLLTLIGLPMAAGTVLFAGPMIKLMFGPGFEDAVGVLQVLGLMFIFAGSYASGAVMNAAGKEKLFSISYTGFVILQLILTIILVPHLGPIGASLSFFLCSAAGFVFYAFVCHRFLLLTPDWKMAIKALIAASIMVCLCKSALLVGTHFAIVAALSLVIYGVFVFLLRLLSLEEWLLLRRAFSFR